MFALVQEGTIIETRPDLEGSWKNISNFGALSPCELQAFGWMPVVYPNLTSNQKYSDTPTIHADWVEFSAMPLTPEELDERVCQNTETLWQSATAYQEQFISGAAVGLLVIGVLQQKPKALAVMQWVQTVWNLYYVRKAMLPTAPPDVSFSIVGPMPYSVPELQTEILG